MKKKIDPRLARIEGQVRGIRTMVRNDRYCVDILMRLRGRFSIEEGRGAGSGNHLNTCVSDAIRQGNEEKRAAKLKEVMDVISSFRRQ